MASSGIISSTNGKIFDELLPNPYPYPAQPPSLAQVLTAGDDAGNGNIENLDILQTTNVVQQDTSGQQFLVIGGTITTPGSGGDLRIQGATLKGSILAGNGTSTVGLPVGANGLVLKANSGAPLGVEWGTDASGGTVMAVNAGTNISITGTIAQPIVNLQNPLSAQLNIGTQQIFSSVNSGGSETSSLNINTNTAVNGLVELDFNDVAVPKSISAFNNIRISNIEAGAVMKFDTNDTGTGEIKTALKTETIKENEHQISIAIVDTGGLTNGEITRTIITSGDETGCEDTITSTDNTNNRVALRKEETDWAFGVVDTTTYTSAFLGNTVASRISTANGTTVSDAFNFGDGLSSVGFSSAVSVAGGSALNQTFGSAGIMGGSQIIANTSLAQHQLRRQTATQQAYIQNNAEANLSRLQGQLIDTGIGNYSTIDTTNSNCEIRQQVSVSGTTKNASLLTTNALTTLTSDAPLTVSTTGGNLNVNASNIAGMAGASVSITASSSGLQLSAPASNITSTSLTGQQVVVSTTNNIANPTLTITNSNASIASYPVIRTDRPTPVSVAGDVLGAISTWADDASGVSREWTRIQTNAENVSTSPANQDGTLSFWGSINGTVSQVANFNGAQNENNMFRPLDMNGNDIRSNSGSMIISTLPSSGTGNLDVKAKASAQFGGETGFTNVYNTGGEIQFNCAGGDWVMTCPAWESPTAGGNSGNHLRIKLNGVYYKIKLEND